MKFRIKRHRKGRTDRRDPIADYVEWSENRYNPGYWLGGNIHPTLRKSTLSPRGRRLAGALLGVTAILNALMAIGAVRSDGADVVLACALIALLTGAAAIGLYRSGRQGPPSAEE